MAKDPAVLFYTSDFLSGTQFLTDEECGKYIRLLCQQHQCGHIPRNHMINICKSDDSLVIKKFSVDGDGNYYNERMEQEKLKRSSYCKSRSNNKSGRKPNKSYDLSYDNHMLVHMENENENENKDVNALNALPEKPKKEKVVPEWKEDFSKYELLCKGAANTILFSEQHKKDIHNLYQKCDIKRSLQKSLMYWATEDKWKEQKRKPGNINMVTTLKNNIDKSMIKVEGCNEFDPYRGVVAK